MDIPNFRNPRYIVPLAGRLNITAPGICEAAIVDGGQDGFLFAADTAAYSHTGHLTVVEIARHL